MMGMGGADIRVGTQRAASFEFGEHWVGIGMDGICLEHDTPCIMFSLASSFLPCLRSGVFFFFFGFIIIFFFPLISPSSLSVLLGCLFFLGMVGGQTRLAWWRGVALNISTGMHGWMDEWMGGTEWNGLWRPLGLLSCLFLAGLMLLGGTVW